MVSVDVKHHVYLLTCQCGNNNDSGYVTAKQVEQLESDLGIYYYHFIIRNFYFILIFFIVNKNNTDTIELKVFVFMETFVSELWLKNAGHHR